MARLTKIGLDYFPLNIDIDQDDKIALIEAQHGILGFGVIIKLLMKIYANGYYYEWGEKEQLLFSNRINVNINSLNAIIDDSIKWGLFDISKYEKYGILTSRGIQKRYFEATTRRQSVVLIDAYACLSKKDLETYKNIINVNINSQNDYINTLSSDVDVDINPQSKVEKSKGKESKVKESNETDVSTIQQLSNLWMNCGYGTLNGNILESLLTDVEIYSLPWVLEAIEIGNTRGKRSYAYVKGVLNKKQVEGEVDKSEPGRENKPDIEKPRRKYGRQRTEEELDAIDVNDPSII